MEAPDHDLVDQPERRYAGLSPRERSDARRQRLLDAGLALFGTQGYAVTAVPAVCARARVAPRHFYELFANREALLRAVYDAIIADVTRRTIAARDAEIEPRARMRAALLALLHAFLDDPRRVRINNVEVVGVSPELEQHRRAVRNAFAQLVEDDARRYHAHGLVRTRRLRLASIALVGAVNELLIDAATGDEPAAADELAAVALELFLAGFPPLRGQDLQPD